MESYIHFIRHGLTEGNVKRWFYGATDVPLLEEGIATLEQLRDNGIYPPLMDADCYTSGMLRTRQTLETIYGPVSFNVIEEMREMNFGSWECKTYAELKNDPESVKWMNEYTESLCYPGGGESAAIFHDRVKTGLEKLIGFHRIKELSHRHSGLDAISIMVCHGGVISSSLHQLFPDENENFWHWLPDPGHGYTVYFSNGEPVSWKKF